MATSGSISFTVNRDEVITEALEQLGVLADGESPSADQLTSYGRKLNMLVKTLQADGLNLFAVQELHLIPQASQNKYGLGGSSTDHLTATLVKTTLSTAGAATDGTVVVTSYTGMSNGDNIGVQLDDGTIQWTTINGAPVSTTVTLTTALTGAAAAGNAVYVYTTAANRPMKILNVNLRSIDDIDTPVWPSMRMDYINITTKTQTGETNEWYYDPQINTGEFYVWPIQTDVSKHFVLWVQRTLEDFNAATDNPDFPQEWFLPLAFNLALLGTAKEGVTPTEYRKIEAGATYWLSKAESFDTEDFMILQPEINPEDFV